MLLSAADELFCEPMPNVHICVCMCPCVCVCVFMLTLLGAAVRQRWGDLDQWMMPCAIVEAQAAEAKAERVVREESGTALGGVRVRVRVCVMCDYYTA